MKNKAKYKRTSVISMLFCFLTLNLTSCQGHWFGKSIEFPWYFIAIPAVIIFIIAHISIVRSHYKCPQCGNVFRPKWYEISSWLHMNGKRVVKCPQCGRKGFCEKAS